LSSKRRFSAVAGLVVGLLLAAVPSAASEHDHGGSSASAEASQLDPKTAEIARRLWGDLVCLCGRCERLTLSACHCPDAAAERKKVLELLRGRDLASSDGAEAAYQVVVKEYVARFGGRHVLASEQRRSSAPEDWPALAVSVAVVAVACAAVAFLESRRRRRKRLGPRRRS
jgi:hypothetical protein